MKRALKMWFQILTTMAALATLTSATYAWFTTNRQVSTSAASARTGTESLTLEISSSGGGQRFGCVEASTGVHSGSGEFCIHTFHHRKSGGSF